jgi:voltage-gated potassium channel
VRSTKYCLHLWESIASTRIINGVARVGLAMYILGGGEMVNRRFITAVSLVLAVFLYGTVGHYLLLYPEMPLAVCALRTIFLLATINESFSVAELGPLYDTRFIVFTLSLVVFGIAVILYALSTITAFLVEGDLQEIWRQRKMNKDISKLSGHFIICGGGETGHYIANELQLSGHQFVVVEIDHERIERLKEEGLLYVEGDAAEEMTLERAGIRQAKGVAISLPTDKENLFVTITARQMNQKLKIITKGIDINIDQKLQKAGADKVVRPAFIGGMRIASELIRPTAVTFIDKMLQDPEDTTRIEEVIINADCELNGRTISESQFRQKTGLQVLAAKRPEDDRYCYQPDGDTRLQPGTTLIVIGRTEDVDKARRMAGMG